MEYNKGSVMEGHKKNIEQYGVSITGVCSGFAYTVGMSMLGLPDLIISTTDFKMATWVLNTAFIEMRDKGFKRGENNTIATMPMDIKLIEINRNISDNYICQTLNFYHENPFYVGENGVRFAQIIWQDEKGLYPSDKNYNKKFKQELFKPLTLN